MQSEENWTPVKLVQWIAGYFKEKDIPGNHRLEAEKLVSKALGIERIELYLQFDRPAQPEELDVLKSFIRRRHSREPVDYILGSTEFWSLSLQTGPGVLIPRPDTETLIETALTWLPECSDGAPFSILELGTGTAAIPLALASERSNLEITTCDISSEALSFAQINLKQHAELLVPKNNQIYLTHSDKFKAVPANHQFQMIISNPPYIDKEELQTLAPDVLDWEPQLALDGGETGLDFYEYLIQQAPGYLAHQGVLLIEHGYQQKEQILDLIHRSGHFDSKAYQDINGKDRVISAQLL